MEIAMELHNKMFEKLKKGEPVIGCQLRSRSATVAELLGYCGMDYVFIDGEHFAYDYEHTEDIIRAVKLSGATPIMRIPSHEQSHMVRALVAGIEGIIAPHIETREQAEAIVHEVKFPPLGSRGFGSGARSAMYSFVSPNSYYMEQSNNNVMAIGMIESFRGLENLDEILESGLDVIRIGAGDLSQDMGYGGAITDEVAEVVEKICAKIKASPKVILGDSGLGGLKNQDDYNAARERGCYMFNAGNDLTVLKNKLTSTVESFHEFTANYKQA